MVALVITIVILIILATITINVAFGEGGLIERAQQAKELTEQATKEEAEKLNAVISEYEDLMAENTEIPEPDTNTTEEPEPEPEEPPIDRVETKIGYYADVDGDEEPDGIIYADLAESKSGQWTDDDGTFSYSAKTNLKDYYISKTNYEGPFGTKDVITAVQGDEREERFYVMALEDFNDGNGPYYCWYAGALGNMTDYATATSEDFGSGRANTIAMIANWNKGANGGYGAQDAAESEGEAKDMWGVIQTEAGNIENPTWFVPSRAEWSAFASNLNIMANDYVNYGLFHWYWSSSQYATDQVWIAHFDYGYLSRSNVDLDTYVRLSATF